MAANDVMFLFNQLSVYEAQAKAIQKLIDETHLQLEERLQTLGNVADVPLTLRVPFFFSESFYFFSPPPLHSLPLKDLLPSDGRDTLPLPPRPLYSPPLGDLFASNGKSSH